jgi:hypothetical protein
MINLTSSTCSSIGTCRHPDYIPGRVHTVVFIIMSTNDHLPSSRLYLETRSYCSVQHTSTRTPTATCHHSTYIWGRGHIVVYNIHQHAHQSAPAVILAMFRGKVISQCTSLCPSISTGRHLDYISGEVMLQCTTYINSYTYWHLPSSRLSSGARSYCSVRHTTSACSPICTCRHPVYIPGRGHTAVYTIVYTNRHLPLTRLYLGRGHIVVYNIHQHAPNRHLPSSWL